MNLNQNLNEEIYFKKYLKYKSKYSKLMNLIGGVPEKKIFIISSHMNRMVIAIFETLVLMGKQVPKVPEVNFVLDNCTILKIDKVEDKVNIRMMFPTVNSNPARFKHLREINELELSFTMPDFPRDLIIYLVRHGQGFHNVPGSSIEEMHDAQLTPIGKGQIIPASDAIQQDIETMRYENYKIFLGCSHLKRTWQTVYNLYNRFSEKLKHEVHKEIFIIPCLHEMIRQIDTPQHYEFESPHKRTALNPFSVYKYNYRGSVTKPNIADEDLKKDVLESQPKNYIYNITERSYNETDSEPIPLIWSFYEDTHISKQFTYEQCAEITVIKAICNFYNYLQTNRLFE